MEYKILGELEVEDRGRAVELGGARQRALLTNLLLHASEVVSADRLIDDLYGARPPATAAKSLQAHVSRLRKALGPEQRLRTRGGGYVLELSDGELDVERFSKLLEEGRRSLAAGRAEQAVATLEPRPFDRPVGATPRASLPLLRCRSNDYNERGGTKPAAANVSSRSLTVSGCWSRGVVNRRLPPWGA
jgi:DNA-binding SARP family transcriptional activator